MAPIKGFIFDLDGTLIDSLGVITDVRCPPASSHRIRTIFFQTSIFEFLSFTLAYVIALT